MFAIYDVDGRRFRDTLENLRKVKQIQSSSAALSHHALLPRQAVATEPGPGDHSPTAYNSAVDAYRKMRSLTDREPILHAYQLMNHPVITIAPELSIVEAQQAFYAHSYQQLPVLNANKHLIGLLTIKSLLQFIIVDAGYTHYISGKQVQDAMIKEVIAADPVSDIRRIARAMQEYHLDAVPIVNDQDSLVGIVSRSDILRAVMNDPPLTAWS